MTGSSADVEDATLDSAQFDWKDQATRLPRLTHWLVPYLQKGALKRFRRPPGRHLYLDDPAWFDHVAAQADVSLGELAVVWL
ncbi:MAG TPA: hypothetical protein VKQ27_19235 [Acetobacteraceae bacterium]|nr:hypothetical protein [Acetobacteraceae bacterium]